MPVISASVIYYTDMRSDTRMFYFSAVSQHTDYSARRNIALKCNVNLPSSVWKPHLHISNVSTDSNQMFFIPRLRKTDIHLLNMV